MSTVEKGDELENNFYRYLINQKDSGNLVYGAYPPQLCKIFQQKKVFSRDREAFITFDIVIEHYREGISEPYFTTVFECKNHEGAVGESHFREFSDKIAELFPNAVKGVVVISSRLQSGALTFAKNRKIGIVKYDEFGLEPIAERKGGIYTESRFVKSQILQTTKDSKSLIFSAFYENQFFSSIDEYLGYITGNTDIKREIATEMNKTTALYISDDHIKYCAQRFLNEIAYVDGPVDLSEICRNNLLKLEYIDVSICDNENNIILGKANFSERTIYIYKHENEHRMRFTIGHEIGHFALNHDKYIRSEYLLEKDIVEKKENFRKSNFDHIEIQANKFASHLILPEEAFTLTLSKFRKQLGIVDRGFGYVYVDDQPDNLRVYHRLLLELSEHFHVSKTVVEIRLRTRGMLRDMRTTSKDFSIDGIISRSQLLGIAN